MLKDENENKIQLKKEVESTQVNLLNLSYETRRTP
jgi:hypothetical protein